MVVSDHMERLHSVLWRELKSVFRCNECVPGRGISTVEGEDLPEASLKCYECGKRLATDRSPNQGHRDEADLLSRLEQGQRDVGRRLLDIPPRIHRLESLKFGCGVVLTLPTSGDPPVDIDPCPDTIFGAIKGGFTSTNEEDIQEAGEKLELLLGESLLEVRFKNQGSDNEYWLVEKWKCLPIECAQEHDLSPYFRMGEHCGRAVNSVVTGLSQNYELEETLVASTVRRLWLVDGNPSRMPPDWMEKLEKIMNPGGRDSGSLDSWHHVERFCDFLDRAIEYQLQALESKAYIPRHSLCHETRSMEFFSGRTSYFDTGVSNSELALKKLEKEISLACCDCQCMNEDAKVWRDLKSKLDRLRMEAMGESAAAFDLLGHTGDDAVGNSDALRSKKRSLKNKRGVLRRLRDQPAQENVRNPLCGWDGLVFFLQLALSLAIASFGAYRLDLTTKDTGQDQMVWGLAGLSCGACLLGVANTLWSFQDRSQSSRKKWSKLLSTVFGENLQPSQVRGGCSCSGILSVSIGVLFVLALGVSICSALVFFRVIQFS